MKKYGRWIVFGLLAVGVIILLLVVGANEKLRKRLTALLIQEKAKTEINNLKDKATVAKTKADSGKITAEEAEKEAKAAEEAISKQKQALQQGLEKKGLSADEIADSFTRLGV